MTVFLKERRMTAVSVIGHPSFFLLECHGFPVKCEIIKDVFVGWLHIEHIWCFYLYALHGDVVASGWRQITVSFLEELCPWVDE